MEETFCTVCHGRGLDNSDHVCRHCGGTGYEPLGIEDIEELAYEDMILSGVF